MKMFGPAGIIIWLQLADFACAAAPNPQLNILFILADDAGWSDLRCYGSTFYETPHLDRLASQGMKFTDAYAACPVCSPTRAALMTGRYPPRVGITNFIGGNRAGKLQPAAYLDYLPVGEITLAEALKEAGYTTGIFGKWHLGGGGSSPARQGFDVVECGGGGGGFNGVDRADRVTDAALRFLDVHKDKPFFLYLPHNLVHVPLRAKPELEAKYQRKAELLTSSKVKRFRPQGGQHDRRVQDHATYAAMMEDLDTNIGRVLARLDELKLSDRTIVIFTSDNGGLSTAEGSPTSNAPLRAGKGWLYEGGIREPLIVRWPSVVKAGSVCVTPVITNDFYPTLLEACGLSTTLEQHVDGASIAPLFKGGRLPNRPLFWHYPHYSNQGGGPAGAVRLGDWKLIEFYEDQRAELYNLRADVGENRDLAANRPDKVRELRAQLANWRQAVGAKMPSTLPDSTADPPTRRAQPRGGHQQSSIAKERLRSDTPARRHAMPEENRLRLATDDPPRRSKKSLSNTARQRAAD